MYDMLSTSVTREIERDIARGVGMENKLKRMPGYSRTNLADIIAILQKRELLGEQAEERKRVAEEFLLALK